MKIKDLTDGQLEKIVKSKPTWVGKNRPKWMADNNPEWMSYNRPKWMFHNDPGEQKIPIEIIELLKD